MSGAVTGEVVEFSKADRAAHAKDEEIVEKGMGTFVEVGRALLRIRERRTYLMTYATFGSYVRERFRFNPPYAYNLMAGAEVIEVLEGQVEILPANARVAYELRNFIDTPDELVKVWTRALEEYGDKPLGKEVAKLVRPPKPAEPPLERPSAPKTGAFADYVAAIDEATAAIEKAKEIQRQALRGVDPDAAATLARQAKRLRALVTDVQKALVRKA